jgi:serine/threonine protein kinase
MNKEIIAIIDGETEFMDKFEKVLKKEIHLGEEFSIKRILINETDISTKKYIIELSEVEDRLALIMVDVVIFEDSSLISNAPIDLNTSRTIIKDLREKFPDKPIIMVTKHLANAFLPALSWISLEDVDGVFIKQYLEKNAEINEKMPFDQNSFRDIINSAKTKRGSYINPSFKYTEEESKRIVKELYQPDSRSKLQIENIGFTVFKNLMERLFLKKITPISKGQIVSYYRPGFSGCYLFKVEENNPDRFWIMKVCGTDKIKTEVENYSRVKEVLQKDSIPAIFTEPVRYGNFGAFAVELKEDYQTLKDYYLHNEVKQDIFDNLKEVLKNLYQNMQRGSERLWGKYYQFKNPAILRLNSFFEDIKNKEWLTGVYFTREELTGLENFVDNQGGTKRKFSEQSISISTANIHGDLNANNILIHSDKNKIVLIDFANYKEDHIVKDIAKLETDMVFSVLDSNSEKFYSWERISDWKALFDLFEISKLFDEKLKSNSYNAEIVKLFDFICKLRATLKEIYPEIDCKEYIGSLLYYSFHYLTYPDISIQKKVFATMFLIRILGQLS